MDTRFTTVERELVAQLVIDRLRIETVMPSGANIKNLEHLRDSIQTLQVFSGDDWELVLGLMGDAVRNMNVWIDYGVKTEVLPAAQAENLVNTHNSFRAILMKMIGEG